MARKRNDSDPDSLTTEIALVCFLACVLVYMAASALIDNRFYLQSDAESTGPVISSGRSVNSCCEGIENLELMGEDVKVLKVNTARECCQACKETCVENVDNCPCNSWVFCGNKRLCDAKFGECRLRRQEDALVPVKRQARMWTSGLNFGKREGVVGLKTTYGTIHIQLLPECSPSSALFILDLLRFGNCVGCKFYRAEGRGNFWDAGGNHINGARFGPPYALVQGTLDAFGMPPDIRDEYQPRVVSGSVAWVGSGPDFFVSLANHSEWRGRYTVFGSVLPEDMWVLDKMTMLPAKKDVWKHIRVTVLREHVPISVRRRSDSSSLHL